MEADSDRTVQLHFVAYLAFFEANFGQKYQEGYQLHFQSQCPSANPLSLPKAKAMLFQISNWPPIWELFLCDGQTGSHINQTRCYLKINSI